MEEEKQENLKTKKKSNKIKLIIQVIIVIIAGIVVVKGLSWIIYECTKPTFEDGFIIDETTMKKQFNEKFERYAGRIIDVKSLWNFIKDVVFSNWSNSTNKVIVKVNLDSNNTDGRTEVATNTTEMIQIYNKMTKRKYEYQLSYDSEGYVSEIIINGVNQ